MNPTRLFILGALAKHGPMYGHQLRRDARLDRTELWSEVRPGSLYGALHRLAAEGLIEPLRTEQDGQLPARTVYGITDEGHRELRALRAEALQEVRLQPDPVDLALAMSRDLDPDILRGYLDDRVRALSARAAQFDHQRDRLWPGQTVADDLVVEHARRRIRAELDWHQLVLDQIGKLAADSEQAGRAGPGVTVRPLRLLGDPVLRTPCDPVVRFDDALARLVADLLDTVAEPGRAGLAANQIGSGLAVFSYNVDGELGYVINPRVAELRDSQDGPEACLSVPGISADRTRAAYAVVTGSISARSRSSSPEPANWPAACSTKPTTCAASSTSTTSPARSAAASCGTSPRPPSLGDDLPSPGVYHGRLPSKMCLICLA